MKKTLLQLFLVLSLLIPACSANQTNGPKTPQALQPTAVSTAFFQIIRPDGSKFGVTLDALKTLPLKQVTAEGKVEEGPDLLDVLAFAGVTEFTEVTLTGSSNPATLTCEQVDENTILDFNNHGTVKLSTTYIPKAQLDKGCCGDRSEMMHYLLGIDDTDNLESRGTGHRVRQLGELACGESTGCAVGHYASSAIGRPANPLYLPQ